MNWVELVNQNKRFAKVDRKDFITFAAGLVLRELIRLSPARVVSPPKHATGDAARLYEIVDFWPEGFSIPTTVSARLLLYRNRSSARFQI